MTDSGDCDFVERVERKALHLSENRDWTAQEAIQRYSKLLENELKDEEGGGESSSPVSYPNGEDAVSASASSEAGEPPKADAWLVFEDMTISGDEAFTAEEFERHTPLPGSDTEALFSQSTIQKHFNKILTDLKAQAQCRRSNFDSREETEAMEWEYGYQAAITDVAKEIQESFKQKGGEH